MKLAFVEFIAGGPPDAVYTKRFDSLYSESTGLRLQVHRYRGAVLSAHWINENGSSHNPHGPSYIWFWNSGQIRVIQYHINGMTHRIGGPAIIRYDEDGSISQEQWIVNPFIK